MDGLLIRESERKFTVGREGTCRAVTIVSTKTCDGNYTKSYSVQLQIKTHRTALIHHFVPAVGFLQKFTGYLKNILTDIRELKWKVLPQGVIF